MASQPTQTRKRDKIKALFRGKTPQLSVASNNIAATSSSATFLPLQSSDNVVQKVPSASCILPPPQKTFVKSKIFEKDIAILSATYIIEENPELKKLIHLIIVINERDEKDRLNDVLETCAKFSVQLVSAIQAHPAEVMQAITVFILTIEKINTAQLDGDAQSLQASRSMVNDEIAKIKSSHPIFVPDRDIGTSKGLFKVLWATLGPGITFLGIVKEASALIPIPWLGPVIGGAINLLNAVMQTRSNYDDMKQIAATAGDFVLSCAVIHSDRTTEPSNELKRALNKFTKTLEGIAQECDELSRLNPFRRYMEQNAHSGNLQAIRTRLNNAIELFQTESQVNIQLDVHDLRRNLDYAALNSLPNHPRYKPNEYLDGSQDDVLKHISGWIDEPKELVLWMHGPAGLGKSTAAQQLVHLLQSADRLAGGVFLTNLTAECPETVIQMISRQLGENHPRAIASIAEAARKLQGPHRPLRDYLMAYIIDPVHALKYPYQLVIVIDGLDEWKSHELFLSGLAHIPSPSPLKVVLISRPNHSIERVLKGVPIQQYELPPVSQETIESYFDHHFKKIKWRGQIPNQGTVNRLAAHANGLLIWAATVRSLLSNELDERYPHVILDQILLLEEKVGTRKEGSLGRLYHDAIESLFPETDMRQHLQDFLGAMMVLQESLPICDFARLLGMSERPAEEIQRRLAALQTRGNVNHDVIPPAIQQFHVSFLDFLESPSTEYNQQPISINTTETHWILAKRCLEIVFSELLESPRAQTCVYSEIHGVERYAIKFWPLHLSNGTNLDEAIAVFRQALELVSRESGEKELSDDIDIAKDDERSTNNIKSDTQSDIFSRLANALYTRFDRQGTPNDLNEAIYMHQYAVILRPQPHPLRPTSLNGLAGSLKARFIQQGDPNDIHQAIPLIREALILQRTYDPLHFMSFSNLVDSLITHFQSWGSLNNFEESIPLLHLANSLLTRFEQQGFSDDLDEAILFHLEVVLLRPAPHPHRSVSLNNLATVLLTRFKERGMSNDLDEAISLLREVLASVPRPFRSKSLNNLASALLTRFEQGGTSNDLDEAISLLQDVLVLRPASHPRHSVSLKNLDNALQTHSDLRGISNEQA